MTNLDAVVALKEISESLGLEHDIRYSLALEMAIQKLYENIDWISTDSLIPHEGRNVLVTYVEFNDEPRVRMARRENDAWWLISHGSSISSVYDNDVLAWAIPEKLQPYIERRGENV